MPKYGVFLKLLMGWPTFNYESYSEFEFLKLTRPFSKVLYEAPYPPRNIKSKSFQ